MLQLILFEFKSFTGLLKFVNGAAALAELVQEVLEFILEILVLPLHSLVMLLRFVVGCAELEHFGGVVTALLLRSVQLGGEIVSLRFPLSDNFVERFLPFLKLSCQLLGAIHFRLHVVDFALQMALRFLETGYLRIESFDELFRALQLDLQFLP